jgi:hypothetical protein
MKKNCTTCSWAKWQMMPSGKRMLTKPGECLVPATIPHCFDSYSDQQPSRRAINKWTRPDCPLWAEVQPI